MSEALAILIAVLFLVWARWALGRLLDEAEARRERGLRKTRFEGCPYRDPCG